MWVKDNFIELRVMMMSWKSGYYNLRNILISYILLRKR